MTDNLPPPTATLVDPDAMLAQVLAAAAECYQATFEQRKMMESRELADPSVEGLENIQAAVDATLLRTQKAHSDLAALTDQHLLSYCQQAEGAEEILKAVSLVVSRIVPQVRELERLLSHAEFDALIHSAFNEPEPEPEQEEPDES